MVCLDNRSLTMAPTYVMCLTVFNTYKYNIHNTGLVHLGTGLVVFIKDKDLEHSHVTS